MKLTLLADTHTQHRLVKIEEPTDYLVFAGDGEFRISGDIYYFNKWISELKEKKLIKEAIVIAGNHDFFCERDRDTTLELFKDCVYLEDESYTLSNGMVLWGSPYTPRFKNWAFLKDDEDLKENWKTIPKTTDIIVTHGPAYKYVDYDIAYGNGHLGSKTLAKAIERIKPKFHICGHIHRDKGQLRIEETPETTFINCGVLDNKYKMIWDPIIIEI